MSILMLPQAARAQLITIINPCFQFSAMSLSIGSESFDGWDFGAPSEIPPGSGFWICVPSTFVPAGDAVCIAFAASESHPQRG